MDSYISVVDGRIDRWVDVQIAILAIVLLYTYVDGWRDVYL